MIKKPVKSKQKDDAAANQPPAQGDQALAMDAMDKLHKKYRGRHLRQKNVRKPIA